MGAGTDDEHLNEPRAPGTGVAFSPALGLRVVPFAAVTALGFGAALLPGAPHRWYALDWSLALLLAAAVAVALPWHRLPAALALAPPLLYLASVAALVIAEGGVARGSAALVLVPVMWVALFQSRAAQVVVVAAVVAALVALSVHDGTAAAIILRRAVLWGAVAGGIAAATHQLRRWLGRVIDERGELLRQATTLEAAAEELTTLRDPHEVIVAAARIAANMASPSVLEGRRANYFVVDGDSVTIAAQFDETDQFVEETWSLAEHPPIERAVRTGLAVVARLADEDLGARLRALADTVGITHGAWVPVAPNRELHGVLAVAGRGQPISADLLQQLVAVGHLVELALANALAHEELARQATTDELTGLANRRGYLRALARFPSRRSFAVIALDLDDLKATNDREGHAIGDAVLAEVGAAVQKVLRRGDLGARVGGDEFVVLVDDADATTARRVAQRIIETVGATRVGNVVPSISLGVAHGEPGADPAQVQNRADRALYTAKRRGGMTCVVAGQDEPAKL